MEIVQTEVGRNSVYEMCHIEKFKNAFDDIDRPTAENRIILPDTAVLTDVAF